MIKYIWVSIAILSSIVRPQDRIEFDVNFTSYVSYYLSIVDLNTGESSVPIFNGTLSKVQGEANTIPVDIAFQIIVNSDALGVYNESLINLTTDTPIQLNDPINISNMDLNLNTKTIYDTGGNAVELDLSFTAIDFDQAGNMFNAIVQSGKLPPGTYTFMVTATPENGNAVTHEEVIQISSANYLQLISPGGTLADTSINEIYTSYPVFQWESDPCLIPGGCELSIRVAEYIPNNHSSVEEAINSQTRLPLDQGSGWEEVGSGLTLFNYPVTNAGDLEPGHIYGWQIKKDMPTTAGEEAVYSDIMVFKVKDFMDSSAGSEEDGSSENDPTVVALKTLVGEDVVNNLLNQGAALYGFAPNGNITLNGNAIDISVLQQLSTQGIAEIDSSGNEVFRPIQILSTRVE